MTTEAAADVIALIIVVASLFALLASGVYSIPYAVRRVRVYPDPSARRTFAVITLVGIIAPTVVVALFLATGAAALAIEDPATRSAVIRPLLLAAILIVAAQVVLAPVGHRYIQDQAEREEREREREERSGVSDRLDDAERDREDRYAEGELEKSELRNRLDDRAEGVSDRLDARADDVKGRLDDQADEVRARLDRQDEEIGRKLDEMLDILRRGR